MSRATDLYEEIKSNIEKFFPAQSILPNQIYRAINRAQIWLCSEHDALFDSEDFTINLTDKEYPLTKTFKRITRLVSPDFSDYAFVKPELIKSYGNGIIAANVYTFINDKIIFPATQIQYNGQNFTVYGWIIPTVEASETQELSVPIEFDDALLYYAMYRLLPPDFAGRPGYLLEAEKSALSFAGKNNTRFNAPTDNEAGW